MKKIKLNYYEINSEVENIRKRAITDISEYSIRHSVSDIEVSEQNSSFELNEENISNSSANISFTDSSNSDYFFNSSVVKNIWNDIAEWTVQNSITNEAANNLLKLLKKNHPNLPTDVRTLKKTVKRCSNISQFGEGCYSHIGIAKNIYSFLEKNSDVSKFIQIDVGIDGVPLAKSSTSQLWPILCNIFPSNEIFLAGVFHRYHKPFC